MTKRFTLAVVLAALLSIAGASMVLAQDEAGMEPAFFSAQFGDSTGISASDLEGADPEFGGTTNITGITVESSDPRSGGVMDLAVSSRCFGAEECPDADIRALSMRLENGDGSWVGTGLGLAPETNERSIEVWNLSGEGDYEGLGMVLVVGPQVAEAALKGEKIKNAAPSAWGWISPISEIPAVPDLPASE